MDPTLSDLRCKLNPRIRCKSLSFQMSGPSPNLGFRRLEYWLVDEVENLRSQRISGFHRLSSCCWLEAKKPSNSWFQRPMSPHGWRQLTRVNSANVLDEGLRIRGSGSQINSKVEIRQTRRDLTCIENKPSTQLAQSQSVPLAGLSWPLYIGGQVSRHRSGSMQITMFVYDVISYFDYIYALNYLTSYVH
jgi:hypothetical protein